MLEYIKGEESTHHGCSCIIIPIPQPPRIPRTCQFSAWTLPEPTCSRWLPIVVHCMVSNWYHVIAFRSSSPSIESSQSQVCGYHQRQGRLGSVGISWMTRPGQQLLMTRTTTPAISPNVAKLTGCRVSEVAQMTGQVRLYSTRAGGEATPVYYLPLRSSAHPAWNTLIWRSIWCET